ncbi:MAG TPA: hypothetical protein VK149_03255 [Sideroxyarcus sp.]|nr:hypothetical protein [Sideroxyarcus sp.]
MSLLRKVLKWGVLGVAFTAIATAFFPGDGGTPQTARATAQLPENTLPAVPARARMQPVATLHVELERLARPQQAEMEPTVGNVFGATSWYVPPPTVLAFEPPPPPPPPGAPPLPFAYLGRYEDAPTRLVILTKGEQLYTVAEGEVIENTYRVERVTAAAVELTYLPLNIRQTLSTGEAL